MKKISHIYENSDYELRLKAPVLNVFLLFIIGAMLLFQILQMLESFQLMDLVTNFTIIAIAVAGIILLRKEKYRLGSSLFLFAVTFFLFISNLVDGYLGEHVFGQRALIFIIVLLCGLFFTVNFKLLISLYIFNGLLFLIDIFILVLPGLYTEETSTLGDQLMVPVLIYAMVIVLSLLLRRTMDRIIGNAKDKTAEAEEKSLYMSSIAKDAGKGLQEARTMEEQAVESASATVQIEENINGITKNVEELSGQFGATFEALNQITGNMDSLENVATDQSANITETGAALEEMVASIASVTQVIQTKMESVDTLSESARSGATVIGETVSSFSQVMEHLDSVKQMITIISSVASQTNLLAMNAAIEAAHAGESGRGFAVVSDEVRKLAESSSVNAKQVSDTIKQLVSSIEQAGGNIERTGETFSAISGEIEQVGQAMEEISGSVKELAAGNDEILAATKSMNDLTVKVTDNVGDVRTRERQAQENIGRLGDFVRHLDESMNEIKIGVAHIRESSLELQNKSNRINEFVKDLNMRLE